MKKILVSMFLLVFLLCLTGCYKQEKFDFEEGRYEYAG